MQHTVAYCNARQHTATHCNTLQHTATHCNTLQHITTHCNTEERHQLNLYLCICVHVYTYIYIYTVRRHSGVHCAGSYFVQPYKRQANPISGGKHPQTCNVCAVQTQRPQRQRNTKVYVEQILKTFIIQQSMAHRDLKFSKIRVNRAFSSFFLTVSVWSKQASFNPIQLHLGAAALKTRRNHFFFMGPEIYVNCWMHPYKF